MTGVITELFLLTQALCVLTYKKGGVWHDVWLSFSAEWVEWALETFLSSTGSIYKTSHFSRESISHLQATGNKNKKNQ